jgi:hypothetical protein
MSVICDPEEVVSPLAAKTLAAERKQTVHRASIRGD